jgi:hypothetical protein
MSRDLRAVLTDLADQMPPAATDGIWQAGRRLRRRERIRSVVRLVAAVAVLAALGLAVPWRPAPVVPAGGEAAVPHRIWVPWMWQATVAQDPVGPATVLFSGDGLGLRGIDGLDHEGKVAVVGQDGSYRMLLYGGAMVTAGEDVLVSPDGRYVAHAYGSRSAWLTVTDLTTGRDRAVAGPDGPGCCGTPVAWAPDGQSLLALHAPLRPNGSDPTGDGTDPARLVLVDLRTGGVRILVDELGYRWRLRTASLAAFSPDGAWLAVTQGSRVSLLDRAGRTAWTRDLGPGRYLAGVGAFSPDGRRIATVSLDGCLDECDTAALGARVWRFDYLDARSGADTDGPAFGPVTAMAVRALGWRSGSDLVVLCYRPEVGARKTADEVFNDTGYREVGEVTLVAVRPGGGTEVLLDPPGEVLAMDVPRDLLESGRFGGPAREPAPWPARPLLFLLVAPVALPLLGATVALVVVLRFRRRRRRGLDLLRRGRPA